MFNIVDTLLIISQNGILNLISNNGEDFTLYRVKNNKKMQVYM